MTLRAELFPGWWCRFLTGLWFARLTDCKGGTGQISFEIHHKSACRHGGQLPALLWDNTV